MKKIHVLDKALAELIAAGEVVERPASIAKELIENSIDAGASSVTVEIEGGGVSLLRITDNGVGIAREDIPTAFLRHATSKVSAPSDLEGIITLGFRGEALASIAAMCRVELLSKTAEETEGTLYRIEGGEELEISPAGAPTGTVITVRDVFYNTPARMKFLKKDVGEGNAVAQVVEKCALSHPEIAFRFIRDGKTRLQTSGGGDLLSVIRAVYGREFASGMIPVEYDMSAEGVSVGGYVTGPSAGRPSRAYQNFFLNSRYVRTRTGIAALEEACKTFIGHGKFPGCVLHIEISPGLVDINVHPAKIEVRFVDERPVFRCICFAVKSALSGMSNDISVREESVPVSGVSTGKTAPAQVMTAKEYRSVIGASASKDDDGGFFRKSLALHASRPDIYVRSDEGDPANPRCSPGYDKKIPLSYDTIGTIFEENAGKSPETTTDISNERNMPTPEPESEPQQMAMESLPELRVVGELSGTYILIERDGGLILVDKHAAHERILYEKLKRDIAYGNRQVLLTPIVLSLAPEEASALLEQPEKLSELGFLIEDFGGGSVVVREVPVEMGERDITLLLGDIASKLSDGRQDITPEALDRLYYSIACKGALRARDKNTLPELEALVDMLRENPQITHCPHGRPVLVNMTAGDIQKLFGR